VVKAAVQSMKLEAENQNITLTDSLPDTLPLINGDKERLHQVVLNIISNAVKYNRPEGTVRASLYATSDTIQFLVSDTGIGIAEEHLPRLFERFYRVDKGRSRSMGGTGLGLAIVKHIAVSMGGMIEVHSKLGEGTEFLVTLPRYYGSKEDQKAQEEE
jgi:two-component system phosphate regulon sensor histidine kinase PhoR